MARNITLSDIETAVRQRCDIVNSQHVTTAELYTYINASAKELRGVLTQKFGDEYFLSSYDFLTDGANDTFALPSDHFKLRGVDLYPGSGSAGIPVKVRRFELSERDRYGYPYWGSAVAGPSSVFLYHQQGNNIRFVPTPSGQNTIRLWYVPLMTDLTGSADTLDGFNGWEEYVVVDCCIKVAAKREDDASVFMAQKRDLVQRIEAEAGNRDSAEPAHVIDVYQPGWGGGWW